MKRKRAKRLRKQESTSSVSPSSIPKISHETVFCLFCYKTDNYSQLFKNNQSRNLPSDGSRSIQLDDRLKVCHQFFNQICRNVESENKEEEPYSSFFEMSSKLIGTRKDEGYRNYDNIYGACSDCFYMIELHCNLFQQIEDLQKNLKSHLKSIYNVMKFAGKVSSRVKTFKESFVLPSPQQTAINGKRCKKYTGDHDGENQLRGNVQGDLNSVLGIRQKIFQSCRNRLKGKPVNGTTSLPVVPPVKENDNMNNDDIQILEVVKKEVEDVTLDVHPTLFSEPEDDMEMLEQAFDPNDLPFSQASWMEHHNISHIDVESTDSPDIQIYKCIKCPEKYSSEEELRRHSILNNHFDFITDKEEDKIEMSVGNKVLACHFCDFAADKVKELVDHEMKLHSGGNLATSKGFSVKCPRCPEPLGKRLFDRSRHYLKWHIKMKLEYEVACGGCDKVYLGYTPGDANGKLRKHCKTTQHSFLKGAVRNEVDRDIDNRADELIKQKEKKDCKKIPNCWFCRKNYSSNKSLQNHLKKISFAI